MKTCILFAAINAFSIMAQAQTSDTTSGTSTQDTSTDTDRRGFNPGWLGLLGLAGLAGLMRRNEDRGAVRSNLGNTAKV